MAARVTTAGVATAAGCRSGCPGGGMGGGTDGTTSGSASGAGRGDGNAAAAGAGAASLLVSLLVVRVTLARGRAGLDTSGVARRSAARTGFLRASASPIVPAREKTRRATMASALRLQPGPQPKRHRRRTRVPRRSTFTSTHCRTTHFPSTPPVATSMPRYPDPNQQNIPARSPSANCARATVAMRVVAGRRLRSRSQACAGRPWCWC